jgi:hypothetical protein
MASATEIITLARNIADRHGLDETLVCAVRHAGKTLVKIGTAAYPDTTAASVQQTWPRNSRQGPPYGAVVYYARTIGLDGKGNVVYSTVAVAPSAQVTPASPFNLAITVK